ncbi:MULTISPECIES: hypothetical protein [Neisseria]|uniref:hypothetical protein n=1 Tax=Neisseria TaxID=482 RepID=UPI001EFC538D|nr:MULTISPECIES: hypothetical protein [Neisseria]
MEPAGGGYRRFSVRGRAEDAGLILAAVEKAGGSRLPRRAFQTASPRTKNRMPARAQIPSSTPSLLFPNRLQVPPIRRVMPLRLKAGHGTMPGMPSRILGH